MLTIILLGLNLFVSSETSIRMINEVKTVDARQQASKPHRSYLYQIKYTYFKQKMILRLI